ncbi:MAG: hypothetical protein JST62_00355 [Bacteroidetes bacterium]|nr:hypothetical protein [Bacteroidota bacterium]
MEGLTLLKLLNPILKFLGFAKKQTEKNYAIHKLYKNLGVAAKKEDFDSLYNQTLYDFEHKRIKHSQLVDLFKLTTAKKSLQNEYYNKTEGLFYDDLNTNLNVVAKFEELKDSNINLQKEVIEFLEIFNDKLNESKLPKEVETSDSLREIKEQVDKLFLHNKNIHLPEQLKEINGLRKNNNHNAVIDLLTNYKENKWTELTPELKYSVTLNFAITYFDLGEKKKGAKYFIELQDFNINQEEAWGYASLGYALLGDTEKSIEYAHKALEKNTENIYAYLGLLFSKEDTMDANELDTLIPKHIQDKPEIAINIGTYLEKKKEFERAFEIFEKINLNHPEMDSFKCDVLVQLGNNRMISLEHKDDFFFNQLDEDSISKVKYASEKFEEAWTYLKNTDLRNSRWYILTNKGVSYKVLGKKDKAEEDFKASLELNKNFFTYRHLLLLKMDANENAAELIKEIETLKLTEEEIQELTIFKADELFASGKNEDALKLLLEQLPKIKSPELTRQYLSMITETYIRLNNLEEAEKYALNFAETNPEDPISFYNLSKIYLSKSEVEQGSEYLMKAKTLLNEKTPRFIADFIADKFNEIGEYKLSAETLELIANPNILSKVTRKLITAYYHSGNHKKAINTSLELLKKNPEDPFLIDIISSIYETTEKYDEAISTIESYLEKHPDDKFMLAKISMNYCKKEDYESGAKVLDKITDYSQIPLQVQFLIAHAYIQNKNFTKGLEIAYKLRTENYADPSVHTRYVQCVTSMENQASEVYFPNVISNNCYVVLKDKNEKKYEFIIVDKSKYPNEISIDEPLAKNLIDKPILGEVELNGEILTVQSILWKYTYALHDSMDQLSVRFGNTQPIKVFKLKEGDNPLEQFQDIFKSIDKNQEFDKQLEELYLKGKSTIGVNANLSNLSPLKYWSKLMNSWDIGITSIGTTFEFQIGLQLLASNKPIIFDIISLLTLLHIDAFETLSKLVNKKYVTKSTIEIIEKEIADLEGSLDGETLMVNKIGGQYLRHIITVDDKKRHLKNLQHFLTEVRTYCEIVIPELSENYIDKKEKDKLFGISFNDTIIVSKEKDCILCSDDLFFRLLCFNEDKINGISTFNLLMYQERNKNIEGQNSLEYLEKLIKLNYRNIPSNAKLLYKIFQDCGYQIKQPYINACDFINPNFIPDVEGSKLIIDFLYEVYISSSITTTKSFVTQHILSKLFAGRNAGLIKRYLIALLDTRFFLLPTQREEILQILRTF